MEPEDLLLHLQVPATCRCLEPDQSSPCPHPFPSRSVLILSSYLRLGLPNGLILSDFPIKPLYAPLPHTCYMPHLFYSSRCDQSVNVW